MVAGVGACVIVGGCVWLQGGVHGCGGVRGGRGACVGYDEIRSMSGQYASYWNAFLFNLLKPKEYSCVFMTCSACCAHISILYQQRWTLALDHHPIDLNTYSRNELWVECQKSSISGHYVS